MVEQEENQILNIKYFTLTLFERFWNSVWVSDNIETSQRYYWIKNLGIAFVTLIYKDLRQKKFLNCILLTLF